MYDFEQLLNKNYKSWQAQRYAPTILSLPDGIGGNGK